MSSHAITVVEQLADAREKLDRACELLLAPSPEALDRCAPLLEAAIHRLAACRSIIAAPPRTDPGAPEEGRRLRMAVRKTRRLLESAAAYHHNWLRRAGTMSAGYDNRGEPAAIPHGRRLILRG
ncbi:MAG TPA: hypothetical protein VLY24_07170 [Bryobacteraceae bacterium]|nr:hypothetical protein [Bryobacteraceae bacterium]